MAGTGDLKLGIASQMSQTEGGYLEQKCHLSQFQLVRDAGVMVGAHIWLVLGPTGM